MRRRSALYPSLTFRRTGSARPKRSFALRDWPGYSCRSFDEARFFALCEIFVRGPLRELPAGLLATPLVDHPEVAILGVHRIAPRPVVRDGEVVVRPMGNVSVTFDHRVVDGARAAEFVLAVIRRLEASQAG